jgi:bifunctional non-homologous end joining protein LigD
VIVRVRGALETPDGAWRVEVVQERAAFHYRILHGDDVIERIPIASVQRILGDAGVDMADLIEASHAETPPAA